MTIHEQWNALIKQAAIFLADGELDKYNALGRAQTVLVGLVHHEDLEEHLDWLDSVSLAQRCG